MWRILDNIDNYIGNIIGNPKIEYYFVYDRFNHNNAESLIKSSQELLGTNIDIKTLDLHSFYGDILFDIINGGNNNKYLVILTNIGSKDLSGLANITINENVLYLSFGSTAIDPILNQRNIVRLSGNDDIVGRIIAAIIQYKYFVNNNANNKVVFIVDNNNIWSQYLYNVIVSSREIYNNLYNYTKIDINNMNEINTISGPILIVYLAESHIEELLNILKNRNEITNLLLGDALEDTRINQVNYMELLNKFDAHCMVQTINNGIDNTNNILRILEKNSGIKLLDRDLLLLYALQIATSISVSDNKYNYGDIMNSIGLTFSNTMDNMTPTYKLCKYDNNGYPNITNYVIRTTNNSQSIINNDQYKYTSYINVTPIQK